MGAMLSFPEAAGLADEVRRLFEELDRLPDLAGHGVAGACSPPMDVIERQDRVEIVMDLAGVPSDHIRVLFKDGTLVIAGCKGPSGGSPDGPTAYHLVERGFGRFVRAIRIAAALDLTDCRAELRQGELRLVVPKLNGGCELQIPVETVL
jgi:HSP20 family protein